MAPVARKIEAQPFKAPILEGDNAKSYRKWQEKIEFWLRLTRLPKKSRALALCLSLSGRAEEASKQIPKDSLQSADGIKVLFAKLDTLYLPS